MQTSGPELIDLSKESKETLEMYGAEPGKGSYAGNCLLARRLVERGVRFVQLYHTDWDHHQDLTKPLEDVTREVDKPTAALIRDLKQRGLARSNSRHLGRRIRPHTDGRGSRKGQDRPQSPHRCVLDLYGGRRHQAGPCHRRRPTNSASHPQEERIEVFDVQATILHLLGLDHTKLTFRSQGRDFRLTDVSGRVIKPLLA